MRIASRHTGQQAAGRTRGATMSAAAQMQTINEDEFDESDMFGGGHRHKSEARRQDGDQLSLDGTDDSESDEMEDPSLHVSSPAAAARSPMLELPGEQPRGGKEAGGGARLGLVVGGGRGER